MDPRNRHNQREMKDRVRDLEIPDYLRAIAADLEQQPMPEYLAFIAQELRGIATEVYKMQSEVRLR